jgi:uncharacterized protein (DUF1697 family)
MPELKELFESLGYSGVKTYLQSGNVVFEAEADLPELKARIENALAERFKYEAYVLLYEFGSLVDFISGYPFSRDDEHHAYCIFVEGQPALDDLRELADKTGDEKKRIAFGDGVVYWKTMKGGTLDTPFAKILAKAKFKSSTTNRNLNTLEKMVEGA